jgi:hypothetical protein
LLSKALRTRGSVGGGTKTALRTVPITNSSVTRGTAEHSKTETLFRKEFNHYEKLKPNNSGIPSGLRHDCVASSKLGQNFGGNRGSRSDVAGGKSLDWSWVGQLGEGASLGECQWSELQ